MTTDLEEGFEPVSLVHDGLATEGRFYPAAGTRKGAIWIGGVGGGWDTPARGLYPRLCAELRLGEAGIGSLRVRFRRSTDLDSSVEDVLAGIDHLEHDGIEAIAVVGHSFGGAVAIRAAARAASVRAVATLATQSFGADPVVRLGPRCATLFVHGMADRVLPPVCSRSLHALAREPKQLRLYPGADHGLDEVADEVHDLVSGWIAERLALAVGDRSDA
jgi:pimeloyl-ACP methyl ester carboxylesterase